MSTRIPITDVHHQDLVELPNGSVYEIDGRGTGVAARLWCAHPPDAPIAEPPLIDLAALSTVRRLEPKDQGAHTQHAGYVRQVFVQEMDRRHHVRMQGVYEHQAQDAAATRQRDRTGRPWWQKLFR